MLALAALAYFAVRTSEFVLSPVLPQVKAGLGVSTAVVGLAFTASTASYALAQLPSGALGDRFGERTVVSAAIGLTGLGSLLLALSPSGMALVMSMTLLGAVGGAYYSPATALLTDRFENTGRAIGIHRVGAQAVGFTAPIVVVVATAYGWRAALALGAVAAFPALAGFRLAVRPSAPVAPDTAVRERLQPGTLLGLLARPGIAYTAALAALAQFVDTATFSFLPALLHEYHGLSLGTAGALFTVYFGALTIAQPAAGWLSDRIGPDPTTAAAVASGAVGYVILFVAAGAASAAVGVGLIGIGMGWGPPIQARLVDRLPESTRGTGFGLVRTVYIGFAALGGVVIGTVVTLWGWPLAIALLAGTMAIPAMVIGANRLLGTEL